METNPTSDTSEGPAAAENTDLPPHGELLRLAVTADVSTDNRPTVRVALEGELDPHTAPKVQREIDEAIDGGCQVLILDLAQLRFLDSAGLRVVILAHKRLEAAGGTLIIESPSDTARRLFEITGLTDHFNIAGAPS